MAFNRAIGELDQAHTPKHCPKFSSYLQTVLELHHRAHDHGCRIRDHHLGSSWRFRGATGADRRPIGTIDRRSRLGADSMGIV
jgi:hypothetical protein